MRVLGLDMSSTCIGYALVEDGASSAGGFEDLTGDIASRASQAAHLVGRLYLLHLPELVVIESPVARFAKAVIPQARVSGAVLARLHNMQALWAEVAPTEAKRALCGDGAATKREMVEAAALALGLAYVTARLHRGKWGAYNVNGARVLTEDEADALAVALAGTRIKVVTQGAA